MVRRSREKQNKQRNVLLRDFGFRIAILLGVALLFFIGFKYSEQALKQKKVNEEVAKLQAEADRLNQENQNFQELVDYFQTQEFKEKEVKDKLNLVKEGEKLILVKEKEIAVETVEEPNEVEITLNRPNYYYWWYYFFGIDKTTQFRD